MAALEGVSALSREVFTHGQVTLALVTLKMSLALSLLYSQIPSFSLTML